MPLLLYQGTAQADDVKFITSTSDIAMAFKGDKGDKGR